MANWTLYDNFRLRQLNANQGNLAASGNSVKIALFNSSLVITQATDIDFLAAPYTSNQVTGTGYSAGGLAIDAGQSVTLAAGTVTYKSSTTITWSQNAAGFSTARYAVMYDNTAAADAKKTLIAYGDLGANVGNVAGDLTITGPATAVFTSP